MQHRITDKFLFFWSNSCFSQWYIRDFVIDGVKYNCAEQYMMASKARLFKDKIVEEKILLETSPKLQKKLGRKVSNFNVNVWEAVAKDIVFEGNKAKFEQNLDLKQELLATGNRILVEASPYDKIWGIGLSQKDDRCLDPQKWLGKNWLGEVLTQLRNSLKRET